MSENSAFAQQLSATLDQLETCQENFELYKQDSLKQVNALEQEVAELENQIKDIRLQNEQNSMEQLSKIQELEQSNTIMQENSLNEANSIEYLKEQELNEDEQLQIVLSEILEQTLTAESLALPDLPQKVEPIDVSTNGQLNDTISQLVSASNTLLESIRALKDANKMIRESLRSKIQSQEFELDGLETEKNLLVKDNEVYEQQILTLSEERERSGSENEQLEHITKQYESELTSLSKQFEAAENELLMKSEELQLLQKQFNELESREQETSFYNDATSELLAKQKQDIVRLKAENEQLETRLLAFASVDQEVILDKQDCCELCENIENEGLEEYLAMKMIV